MTGKWIANYHVGINECIFKLAVTGQELMPEEGHVLDAVVKGHVDGEVGR